jgi:hypothetical protein
MGPGGGVPLLRPPPPPKSALAVPGDQWASTAGQWALTGGKLALPAGRLALPAGEAVAVSEVARRKGEASDLGERGLPGDEIWANPVHEAGREGRERERGRGGVENKEGEPFSLT